VVINVFISIDPDVSKDEARRRIGEVLARHPDYTGKIILIIWIIKEYRTLKYLHFLTF
jgi:hypothetical protein